ncbi:hypothetical protein, partial [Burkholderia cenocepacia]|uniref:hypothetical protein n=1 Tax=Burkholderia cenocepacia TaxID=95486 RepID=UPI00406CF340
PVVQRPAGDCGGCAPGVAARRRDVPHQVRGSPRRDQHADTDQADRDPQDHDEGRRAVVDERLRLIDVQCDVGVERLLERAGGGRQPVDRRSCRVEVPASAALNQALDDDMSLIHIHQHTQPVMNTQQVMSTKKQNVHNDYTR